MIANGLGYEGWIGRLVRSSGTKATLVEAAKGITPLQGGGRRAPGHGRADVDPHAWQSVPNAKLYVAAIRDALAAADPAGKETYEANAAAYGAKLDALDSGGEGGVARIPADRRKVITSHDAFHYFEAAYGLEFIAPQGVSTEAEASAKDVARIIRQIKRERIGAVFLENVSDPPPRRADRQGDGRQGRPDDLLRRPFRPGRPGPHLHRDDPPQYGGDRRRAVELNGRAHARSPLDRSVSNARASPARPLDRRPRPETAGILGPAAGPEGAPQ